jgi:release factor glutamine methyltransferase
MHALDISSQALAVAQQNVARHLKPGQIHFYESDGFDHLPPALKFDLIVTNPPYIPSAEILQLQPEVRDFEPALALNGGPDGLDFYHRLAVESLRWLQPSAWLMAEIGEDQAERMPQIFRSPDWKIEAIEKDYSGRPRILVARRISTCLQPF